jgi:pSer/pThr/pTyr-binding forkhead associated (FHA) protein
MHASLELRDNHWFLQDLGGPGGTSINGQLIEGPQILYHDDIIELGQVRLQFQIDDERATTQKFQTQVDETEKIAAEPKTPAHVSGRVWFAGLAAATMAIIFVILMLIVAAHMMGLIDIQNLLPVLFGGT